MPDRAKRINEIIDTGRYLAAKGLVTARAGNLSCRLDGERILITASGSALGNLSSRDIVCVDLKTGKALPASHPKGSDRSGPVPSSRPQGNDRSGPVPSSRPQGNDRSGPVPSSELPLHRLSYRTFSDANALVHCHSAFINAYFCIYRELKYLTFESRHYLGAVPVVQQKTLTVTDTLPVIKALKESGLVVIRNHGVFSLGKNLTVARERVEILEEAVRVYALARLFSRKNPDALDRALKNIFTGR